MDDEIHKLLKRMAGGDINALGELYEILSFRVFNYARTILKNKESAEDVTHDVFLQIHKQSGRIADMANPEGYITVMTRHHAYNLIKRSKRAAVSLDEALKIGERPRVDDALIFEEAFNVLPTEQREALHLHLICGYTHKEISAILNVPLVTVKWRYGKAIRRLKEYFAQNEEVYCNEPI